MNNLRTIFKNQISSFKMHGRWLLGTLLILIFLRVADGRCLETAESCSDCLTFRSATEDCAWCKDPDFQHVRCGNISAIINSGCGVGGLEISTDIRITRNVQISTAKLISPQNIELKMIGRAGTEVPFKIRATQRWLAFRVSFPKRKFRVAVTSSCSRFRWRPNGRGRCSRTTPGEEITFRLEVTPVDCTANGRISISVARTTGQTMTVLVRSSCSCACQATSQNEPRSVKCSSRGTLTCGQCDCDEGYYGRNCECNALARIDPNVCLPRPYGPVCSNRGECVCGLCYCYRNRTTNIRYSGRYCECDDSSCPMLYGQLCGGPSRGICKCGQCECFPGYQGDSCAETVSIDNCLSSIGILCSNHGECREGVCHCRPGYEGPTCAECPACEAFLCSSLSPDVCKQVPEATICSGRGNCVCGRCQCTDRFYGQFCQCADDTCASYNGNMCGGSTRGECSCGRCVCKPGYAGNSCEQVVSSDSCISFNGEICNGKGRCVEGVCQCEAGYMGRTCHDCPTCPGQCSVLKDCVRCKSYGTGPLSAEECYSQCGLYGIQLVDQIEERVGGRVCQFRDEDNCLFYFIYGFDEDGELYVHSQRNKLCPSLPVLTSN